MIIFTDVFDKVINVDISLPHYRKDGCHYYAVFSDKECITVRPESDPIQASICVNHISLAWNSDSSVECTQAQFKEAFDFTEYQIKQKLYGN